MTVWIVAGRRRTLHKGVRSEGDTAIMSFEACNLDGAGRKEVYEDWNFAKGAADRWCRRCFATGPVE